MTLYKNIIDLYYIIAITIDFILKVDLLRMMDRYEPYAVR